MGNEELEVMALEQIISTTEYIGSLADFAMRLRSTSVDIPLLRTEFVIAEKGQNGNIALAYKNFKMEVMKALDTLINDLEKEVKHGDE